MLRCNNPYVAQQLHKNYAINSVIAARRGEESGSFCICTLLSFRIIRTVKALIDLADLAAQVLKLMANDFREINSS